LQPDATLDGLTDQNFHLGGTNAKGFILTADYGIAPRTWLSARYYGAKQVYGPAFRPRRCAVRDQHQVLRIADETFIDWFKCLCLAIATTCSRANIGGTTARATGRHAQPTARFARAASAMAGAEAQLQQERDDARKALDAAKVELNKNKSGSTQDASALSAERSARAQDEAQIEVLQKDVASANAQSQAQLLHGNDLGAQLAQSQNQVTTCTARNKQLYQIGSEILDAYSHMTMGTVIASREPFAASERVKLENAAQAYGDRLYEQRYDPRETSVKKP
jgi:hypothetical protein